MDGGQAKCHLTDTGGNILTGDDERKYQVTVRKNNPATEPLLERLEATLEAAKSRADLVTRLDDIDFISTLESKEPARREEILNDLLDDPPYQRFDPSLSEPRRERVAAWLKDQLKKEGTQWQDDTSNPSV